MRNKLVVLLASAGLLLATSATAAVFDPEASFLQIRIAGLSGIPLAGENDARTRAVLTGGVGTEVLGLFQPSGGEGKLFETIADGAGTALFTGTPGVSNLFLTIQNNAGTFDFTNTGCTFQGAAWAVGFGGVSGMTGRSVVSILGGAITAPTPLSIVGLGGQATAQIGALTATIFVDGAHWGTGSVKITGIATNIISIVNNAGGRLNVTGVGFTMKPTTNENTIVLTENGVTMVTLSGTTDFSTAGSGVNQVTLISPLYIDASDLTENPPIPGAGQMTLRFTPEPGSLLLLGSAVVGLIAVGRKRMKR